MTVSIQLLGLTGRVAVVLLVLSAGVGAQSTSPAAAGPATPTPAVPIFQHSPGVPAPGVPAPVPEPRMPADLPLVVPAPVDPSPVDPALVDPAVVDTDGAPLREEHAEVVRTVHRALAAGDLAVLGELYAGDDWTGQAELLAGEQVRRSVLDALRADPANLGEGYVYPGFAADPAIPYPGYRTAFFLDYDPPRTADGPLRWRGIAPGTPALSTGPF